MRLPYKQQRWFKDQKQRFKNWFPILWKKRAQIEKQQALQQLSDKHRGELEQEHKRVDELIGRLTHLAWSRDGEVYQMGLRFDARMMYGYRTSDDLRFLAQMIARRVEAEIATARFMQKAEERYSVPPHARCWTENTG